jgi:hypothetical protein
MEAGSGAAQQGVPADGIRQIEMNKGRRRSRLVIARQSGTAQRLD